MALLQMRGITKTFDGGIVANDRVDLTVEEGQIHALLGENGAGKTTLMNILFGLYQPDEGEIFWKGEQIANFSPVEAIERGIGMVHQHFMLVENMSVMQNIIMGMRNSRSPFVNTSKISSEISNLSKQYGLQVYPDKLVADLSVGEQQRVEILKALYRKAKLLILDEPTAVLTPQETNELFDMLHRLKCEGHSIIFITHKLSEILRLSDVVTVLRDGKNIRSLNTKDTNEIELSRLMIGRELRDVSAFRDMRREAKSENEVLIVEKLYLKQDKQKSILHDLTFSLYEGEILGVAGVDGNGQKELAEVLTGIRKASGGTISYYGNNIRGKSIRSLADEGICYIPDDRHRDGLVTSGNVQENLMIRCYYKDKYSKKGVISWKEIEVMSNLLIEDFNIKTPSTKILVDNLSGGNQQKLILARELNNSPKIVIAMQPTRGLDIGAADFIRCQLIEFCNQGGSCLLISTDLDEVIGLSDRIAVMYEGKIMGILDNSLDFAPETIGLLMGGRHYTEVIA